MTKPASKKEFKHDQDKLRYDLLPVQSVEWLVKVLTHGAEKYTPNSWQKVNPFYERYFAALMRHLMAWKQGEEIDPDSGLPHLAHVMCCTVFLLEGPNND